MNPPSIHQPLRYVAGFMFSPDYLRVALIRKAKPVWQAGLLNGIGGKVEQGEHPLQAMAREFREETGVSTEESQWTYFAEIQGGRRNTDEPPYDVRFFATYGRLSRLRSMEAEPIEIVNLADVTPLRKDMIANLPWLIALALDCLTDGRRITAAVFYP